MAIYNAVGQSYDAAPNIWLVRSSRAGRRWVLRSDLHFLLFLYLEFLPGVSRLQMSPKPVRTTLGEDSEDVRFHATYEHDGKAVCVALDREDAPQLPEAIVEIRLRRTQAAGLGNAVLSVITPGEMAPWKTRIQHSLRMLRFINASSEMTLLPVRSAVARTMAAQTRLTLAQLEQRLPEHAAPLIYAAVFQLYQRGRVKLDIDNHEVVSSTLVEVQA